MKIALISDIHANREAFTAVLEHAQEYGATNHAFLGDFVGYGADPDWVVEKVREFTALGSIAVMGNHDAGVLRGPSAHMTPDARAGVEWTREHLKPEHLEWLGHLPMSQIEGDRLYVHANAYAPEGFEYVQGRLEAIRCLQATPCRFVFCGHMHAPMLYHMSLTGKAGHFEPTDATPVPLLPNRQWLAIPGSTGQPRDGNPAACYAMFDTDQSELTFYRVPYDIQSAADRIRAAGLPSRLAERLFEGT